MYELTSLYRYIGPVFSCGNNIYRRIENKVTGQRFTLKYNKDIMDWLPVKKDRNRFIDGGSRNVL